MKRLFFFLIAMTLAVTPITLVGNSGGMTFLKLEMDVRTAAMGGAGTALYHTSSLMHYNPASIADMKYSEIQLMHTSWIQDMSMQYGSGALSFGRASLGIALYNASIEGIEVRTRPGPPESDFTARNLGAAATFAYRLSPSFRAGITGKLLYEKLYVDEATGYGIDVGLQYTSTTPGLVFGVSVLNIGSMNDLRNEPTSLPLTYRIGSSYELPFMLEDLSIRLAIDALQYSGNDKLHLMFGGEIGYHNLIFARVGYHSGLEARGVSAGLGVRHGAFRFDYAYIPLKSELGSGHSLSVGILFR